MPISQLMMAILAMDSYNRGYDEGITELGGLGTKIGNATIIDESDILDNSAGVNAGFYAVAYNVGGTMVEGVLPGGETVISYRGTDI